MLTANTLQLLPLSSTVAPHADLSKLCTVSTVSTMCTVVAVYMSADSPFPVATVATTMAFMLGLQLVHEAGHFIAAKAHGKVDLGLPR
jgi:hypothetical protein